MFAAVDLIDTTTALMGATAFVARRHTLEGHFDPETAADHLVPQLLDGLCVQPARPGPRSTRGDPAVARGAPCALLAVSPSGGTRRRRARTPCLRMPTRSVPPWPCGLATRR